MVLYLALFNYVGNGHGTHVASTIAGKLFGVAKKAQIHAVKVLNTDGSGTISDVVGGIEYVMKEHQRLSKVEKNRKTVLNMSLGGGRSAVMDQAVKMASKAGVHVVRIDYY
jgi:cerevisin